jgi:hypothetical protein
MFERINDILKMIKIMSISMSKWYRHGTYQQKVQIIIVNYFGYLLLAYIQSSVTFLSGIQLLNKVSEVLLWFDKLLDKIIYSFLLIFKFFILLYTFLYLILFI